MRKYRGAAHRTPTRPFWGGPVADFRDGSPRGCSLGARKRARGAGPGSARPGANLGHLGASRFGDGVPRRSPTWRAGAMVPARCVGSCSVGVEPWPGRAAMPPGAARLLSALLIAALLLHLLGVFWRGSFRLLARPVGHAIFWATAGDATAKVLQGPPARPPVFPVALGSDAFIQALRPRNGPTPSQRRRSRIGRQRILPEPPHPKRP